MTRMLAIVWWIGFGLLLAGINNAAHVKMFCSRQSVWYYPPAHLCGKQRTEDIIEFYDPWAARGWKPSRKMELSERVVSEKGRI